MSTIAIIGTGLMANALGIGWTRAGHDVRIGTRSVENAGLEFEASFVGATDEAVEPAEVVVLAVPFPAVAPLVGALKDKLAGKTIIDISNPFDHLPDNARAAVEYTADALGTTDGLVAAFKDNFAATINAPLAADGHRPDVKVAADDPAAKAVVEKLVAELDHRMLDCGPLHNARLIDPMVTLMLTLDRTYCDFTMKTGWRFFGLPDDAENRA
ncbi:NAD(P)-binding domain-containing protein [Microbacterium sp. NPDC028030]|uniref:NADPH-dependent F420 reductase n=1 Tax=Microbacterium sp. NPDC028030 TaxID=3155124 RepID=UPI0033F1B460